MANPLDWLGRAALRVGGMTPQQIRQQARANKQSKPMPKAKASKPKPEAPKPDKPKVTRQTRVHGRVKPGLVQRTVKPSPPKPPKAPEPGSIQPKGQTNLMNAKGQARDFRNPKVSANRPPTLSPVEAKSTTTLKPKPTRPAQVSPGQRNLFGDNPSAKPSGRYRAPDVPKEAPKAAAKPPVKASGAAGAAKGAAKLAGKGLGRAFVVGATIDQAREVLNPKDNIVTNLKDLGTTIENTNARPGKKKEGVSQNDYTRRKNEAIRNENIKANAKSKAKAPSAAKQATDKRDKKKLF